MEQSSRHFQPSSSYIKFQTIFASPNRYFTENGRWVPLKLPCKAGAKWGRERERERKQRKGRWDLYRLQQFLISRSTSSLQAAAVSPFRAQSLLHRSQQFVHFDFPLLRSDVFIPSCFPLAFYAFLILPRFLNQRRLPK